MNSRLQLIDFVYSHRRLLAHIVELSPAHILCWNRASDDVVVLVKPILRDAVTLCKRRGPSVLYFLSFLLHPYSLFSVHFSPVVLHHLFCSLLLDYVVLTDLRESGVVVNISLASLRLVQLHVGQLLLGCLV